MKRLICVFIIVICFITVGINTVQAQCSICTKTAMQQGEKPASGLNSGIVYLMLTPFAIIGFIGYRWWKAEKLNLADEAKG